MAENLEKQIILSYNDPQSPYFLSSSDHPGYIINPVILNGDNYGNWSRLLVNALKSKNKLGFVNGKLEKPSTAPDVHAWEKCDSMVMAWLYNVIDKALHGSVAYANTAREVWIDLEERYSQRNSIRIHQLNQEMSLVG
uniref:Retrotransposon Copia-like N-terminal domain-containing protein n=1 Tax=Opuntia streptacantha TaxID=393608 RepID=A0A7C9A7L8_OPUST